MIEMPQGILNLDLCLPGEYKYDFAEFLLVPRRASSYAPGHSALLQQRESQPNSQEKNLFSTGAACVNVTCAPVPYGA